MADIEQDRIERAVARGRKTQREMRLIENWCGNAKFERFGGVGVVEEIYQVPIGNFFVQCDHASRVGIAAWDLEETFLDFYDRNCATCTFRAPKRKPDIQPRIDAHIKRRKALADEKEKEELAAAAALKARQDEREHLRPGASIKELEALRLLDEIDVGLNADASAQFLELSKLAPEAFGPQIIDYLIKCTEDNVPSLAQATFNALRNLPVEPDQWRSIVVEHLHRYPADRSAADAVGDISSLLTEADVRTVLPALTYLADPPDRIFDRDEPWPQPFQRVATAHPATAESEVSKLLDQGTDRSVDLACRVINQISKDESGFVRPFIRTLTAKLLRYPLLLPAFGDSNHPGLPTLRRSVERAMDLDFSAMDKLLQSLLEGADDTARSEVARLYHKKLDYGYDGDPIDPTKEDEVAFSRLLWMAVADAGKLDLDSDAVSFFSHTQSKLARLAASQIDILVGAAATLTERLKDVDKPASIEVMPTGFEEIERGAKKSFILRLQGSLLEWAALGAKLRPDSTSQLLALLDHIPNDQVEMRANMIAHLDDLITSPATLLLVLPYLYRAMTDSEVRIRASAVSAVGKTSYKFRRDFPRLMFELYVVLLNDSYVMVHMAAVNELHIYDFPDDLKRDISNTLVGWIRSYEKSKTNPRFLIECIETYVRGCLTETQIAGGEGKAILRILDGVDGYEVEQALTGQLGSYFEKTDGYVALVVRKVGSNWHRRDNRDPLLARLKHLPQQQLAQASSELGDLCLSVSQTNFHTPLFLFEILLRAEAWSELREAASRIEVVIPDTVRDRGFKNLYAKLNLAFELETSLPCSVVSLEEFSARWDAVPAVDRGDKTETRFDFSFYYPIRLKALTAVAASADMEVADAQELTQLSGAIAEIGTAYAPEFPAGPFAGFAVLLKCFAFLINWIKAIRSAEADADRYLRAARLLASEFAQKHAGEMSPALTQRIERVASLRDVAAVATLKEGILSLPIPFAFFPPEPKMERRFEREEASPPPLDIAFVSFDIDGQPASSMNSITPTELHDLKIEVRVSRWPAHAERLLLTPVTLEQSPSFIMPTFEFVRPAGDGPYTFSGEGRMQIRAAQSIGARPFDFTYSAFFEPNSSEQAVSLIGHRSLRIEAIDIKANPVTGFRDIDVKLLALRNELRNVPGIPDEDVAAIFTVAAAAGALAGRALLDAEFPEGTSEKVFQQEAVKSLRRWPAIGEELEQHPAAGGGITDLSFRRVRIELKATTDKAPSRDEIERFADQAAQYVSTSGKRVGVLAILDSSPKSSPPPPADSQMEILMRPAGKTNVAIVVIVIQGGLARPSDLAKGRRSR